MVLSLTGNRLLFRFFCHLKVKRMILGWSLDWFHVLFIYFLFFLLVIKWINPGVFVTCLFLETLNCCLYCCLTSSHKTHVKDHIWMRLIFFTWEVQYSFSVVTLFPYFLNKDDALVDFVTAFPFQFVKVLEITGL